MLYNLFFQIKYLENYLTEIKLMEKKMNPEETMINNSISNNQGNIVTERI